MVSASARAGLVLAVPAVVGVAAAGRVVAGQLDLAARCFADSALAEGADGDVGSDGSPAGGAWNGHGLIVPRPEQAKPHPPGGRAAGVEARWPRRAGGRPGWSGRAGGGPRSAGRRRTPSASTGTGSAPPGPGSGPRAAARRR